MILLDTHVLIHPLFNPSQVVRGYMVMYYNS